LTASPPKGVLFTELLRGAELHRRTGRRSSPARTRTAPGPDQGGPARGPPLGLQAQDPTIADGAPKRRATPLASSEKNHLGDRDEHLPHDARLRRVLRQPVITLNAEEEPELPDYPKDPEFRKKFGPPRQCCHTWANGDGTQAHRGHRPPLTKEADGKPVTANSARPAVDFITRQHEAKNSFLRVVFNTNAHAFPHAHRPPEERGPRRALGKSGATTTRCWITTTRSAACWICSTSWASPENTIVMYSTDNGPHMNSWARRRHDPRSATRRTPHWEGRLPCSRRWCAGRGTSRPGSVADRHRQPRPTGSSRLFLSAAGRTRYRPSGLARGHRPERARATRCTSTGTTSLAYITGETEREPTQSNFFYVLRRRRPSPHLRFDNWKFRLPRAALHRQPCRSGRSPYVETARAQAVQPADRSLRAGPTSRRTRTTTWMLDHVFLFVPAQAYVANMLEDVGRVSATTENLRASAWTRWMAKLQGRPLPARQLSD